MRRQSTDRPQQHLTLFIPPVLPLNKSKSTHNSNLYFYASMNGVLEAVEKDMQAIETGLLSTKDWCVGSFVFRRSLCRLITVLPMDVRRHLLLAYLTHHT